MEHDSNECDAPTIQKSVLQNGVKKAIREMFGNSCTVLTILEENMQAVIGSDVESRIEEIDGQLKELQQELLKQADIPLEYDEQLVRRLVEKVTVYEEELVVEFKWGLEIRLEI